MNNNTSLVPHLLAAGVPVVAGFWVLADEDEDSANEAALDAHLEALYEERYEDGGWDD